VQNAEGSALVPLHSWLLGRGLKTLALRVERQSSNAQRVVKFLERQGEVREIFYPGLAWIPGMIYIAVRPPVAGRSLVLRPVTRKYLVASSRRRNFVPLR